MESFAREFCHSNLIACRASRRESRRGTITGVFAYQAPWMGRNRALPTCQFVANRQGVRTSERSTAVPISHRNRCTNPRHSVRLVFDNSLVSGSRITVHTGHMVDPGASLNRVSTALSPIVPICAIFSYESFQRNLFAAKEVRHEVIPGVVYGGNYYLHLCRGGV